MSEPTQVEKPKPLPRCPHCLKPGPGIACQINNGVAVISCADCAKILSVQVMAIPAQAMPSIVQAHAMPKSPLVVKP